jgi:hypothetical protein
VGASRDTQGAPDNLPGAAAERFADHLRSVHIALVSVCVAMLVATQAPTSFELQRASTELDAILTLRENLQGADVADWDASLWDQMGSQPDLPTTITRFVAVTTQVSDESDIHGMERFDVPPPLHGPLPTITSEFKLGGLRMFWDSLAALRSVDVLRGVGAEWMVYPEADLYPADELLALLDGTQALRLTGRILSVAEAQEEFRTLPDMSSSTHLWVVGASAEFSGPDLRSFLTMLRAERRSEDATVSDRDLLEVVATMTRVGAEGSILIPLRLAPVETRPLRAFTRQFMDDGHPRSFDRTFGRIGEFAMGIDDLPLENIRSVLDNELRRTGPQVRILGITLPLETLSAWGIFIILALQADFLIHLQWFWRRLGALDTPVVPWVGLYGHPFHNIVFALTAGVLPAGTATWLVFATMGFWPLDIVRIFALISLTVVFGLGIVAVQVHLRGLARSSST